MIKCETMHEIFAGPMGIILKERNILRKKCRKVPRKQFGEFS